MYVRGGVCMRACVDICIHRHPAWDSPPLFFPSVRLSFAQVVANVNGKPAAMYAWLKWLLNDRLRDKLVFWSLGMRKK